MWVLVFSPSSDTITPFFMLNLTEYEISTPYKTKILKNNVFLASELSDVFIMLINVKMPTIVGILTFMSMINFVPSSAQ